MWKRREFTTHGADPTTVVEWFNGTFKITEFQGMYQVEEKKGQGNYLTSDGPVMELGKELHEQLEDQWQEDVHSRSDSDIESLEAQEIARLERKAGWDPNP
jgi:hypothetical protein